MTTLDDKVAFLSKAANYLEKSSRIEVKETHMSWVFLTDRYVYKLKKPVKYPYLDFSTLEKRAFYCAEELRVNSRLAPHVYEDVVQLFEHGSGSLNFIGEGKIVDHLVKMKRLPRRLNLEQMIVEDTLDQKQLVHTAVLLGTFYKMLAREQVSGDLYWTNTANDLEEMIAELRQPIYRIDGHQLDNLANLLSKQMSLHKEMLIQRSQKIVEGHGDLRPEHVFLTEPPSIIDCLEFKREWRLIDPVEELAYLAMECELLGNDQIGQVFFSEYEQATGDQVIDAIVSIYKTKRALLRSLLCYRHLLETKYNHSEHWRLKGAEYLEMTFSYIDLVRSA